MRESTRYQARGTTYDDAAASGTATDGGRRRRGGIGSFWLRIPFVLRTSYLVLLLAACGGDAEEPPTADGAGAPPVPFETAAARVITETDTVPLRVELAQTDAQRAFGLMERDRLDPDAGMVFLYDEDQPPEAGFWMFRTRIPLDIAYFDAEGRIVAIERMEPCPSPNPQWCPSYPPGVPYRSTLEVNAGFFEQHGVGLGDRVEVVR